MHDNRNSRTKVSDQARLRHLNEIRAMFSRRRADTATFNVNSEDRALSTSAIDPASVTTSELYTRPHDADVQAHVYANDRAQNDDPESANGDVRHQLDSLVESNLFACRVKLVEKVLQTSTSEVASATVGPFRSSGSTRRAPSQPHGLTFVRQLARLRHCVAQNANLQHWYTLNRLRTPDGASSFMRMQRMRTYSEVVRHRNGVRLQSLDGWVNTLEEVATESATQTEGPSEWQKMQAMLERDEQSLEHLAEADLAYLDMVRTKAGIGPTQTAGAFAASEAEQALADSWQQLIKLRLKSQKLQLRQQAQPMTDADMERVEAELMLETTRIASRLQQQLQQLTATAAASSPSTAAASATDFCGSASHSRGGRPEPGTAMTRAGAPAEACALSTREKTLPRNSFARRSQSKQYHQQQQRQYREHQQHQHRPQLQQHCHTRIYGESRRRHVSLHPSLSMATALVCTRRTKTSCARTPGQSAANGLSSATTSFPCATSTASASDRGAAPDISVAAVQRALSASPAAAAAAMGRALVRLGHGLGKPLKKTQHPPSSCLHARVGAVGYDAPWLRRLITMHRAALQRSTAPPCTVRSAPSTAAAQLELLPSQQRRSQQRQAQTQFPLHGAVLPRQTALNCKRHSSNIVGR
mmetsp:Transcript_44064/g.115800  ORF Transcript_44064/g.115800 Transcript_44064/m.115800 type:complete len:643 (+) Transcript_44064:82-2010(+)